MVVEFKEIRKLTEDQARDYLESIRWPEGPVCVHCGCMEVTKLRGKSTRPGVYKCKTKGCRKKFTVTVGTIFERSHIPLKTWLEAFAHLCAAKKGVSALQLQRMLGLGSYQTAWHMAHRIRHAMEAGLFDPPLGGFGKDVQADEMFHGGKPGNMHRAKRPGRKGVSSKVAILGLVEPGGRAVTIPIGRVSKAKIRKHLRAHVAKESRLVTDDSNAYQEIGQEFEGGHDTVNHGAGQYVRQGERGTVSTNEIESYWALLRRGITGSYHHISEAHLHRYCNEFAFRWSHRGVTDAERTRAAIEGAEGRRLTYS